MKSSKSVSGADKAFGIFFAILGGTAFVVSVMSLFPSMRLLLNTGVRFDYMVISPLIMLLAVALLTDNFSRGDKKVIG